MRTTWTSVSKLWESEKSWRKVFFCVCVYHIQLQNIAKTIILSCSKWWMLSKLQLQKTALLVVQLNE
jgi:hypothetical protein